MDKERQCHGVAAVLNFVAEVKHSTIIVNHSFSIYYTG